MRKDFPPAEKVFPNGTGSPKLAVGPIQFPNDRGALRQEPAPEKGQPGAGIRGIPARMRSLVSRNKPRPGAARSGPKPVSREGETIVCGEHPYRALTGRLAFLPPRILLCLHLPFRPPGPCEAGLTFRRSPIAPTHPVAPGTPCSSVDAPERRRYPAPCRHERTRAPGVSPRLTVAQPRDSEKPLSAPGAGPRGETGMGRNVEYSRYSARNRSSTRDSVCFRRLSGWNQVGFIWHRAKSGAWSAKCGDFGSSLMPQGRTL